MKKLSNYDISKAGLHYAAYSCILHGWKVKVIKIQPGGDYLKITSHDGNLEKVIKIKTLTREAPIPFGNNPERNNSEIMILCILEEGPELYMFPTRDIVGSDEVLNRKEHGAEKGYWALNNRTYCNDFRKKYRRNWALLEQVH